MPDSPIAHGSSEPLASQPCSKPATYIDFVNPLLWMLFTNLAFSLGPSIMQASGAADYIQYITLGFGMPLFIMSKAIEATTVADLLASSPRLSGRTVTTTILLGAHVGLLAPNFISDFTLFARCTFMLWSVTLGAFLGICVAFGLGRSGFSNKNGDRVKGD
ncbi:hypothetical protein V1504DRAFT_41355 [Lipomyces starkeyi]